VCSVCLRNNIRGSLIVLVQMIILLLCYPVLVDAPNREQNYSKCVSDFKQHAANMATTATAVAKSGVISDKRQLEAITRTVNKVCVYCSAIALCVVCVQ